jgi:hypothetical protein
MTDPTIATIDPWSTEVRELLLAVWLEQACRRPADRPEVLARLLLRWGPAVDEAVAALAAFRDGVPADPADATWRAFPRLDRNHCAQLTTSLIAAGGRDS